jgi:hypothetical protein
MSAVSKDLCMIKLHVYHIHFKRSTELNMNKTLFKIKYFGHHKVPQRCIFIGHCEYQVILVSNTGQWYNPVSGHEATDKSAVKN